MNAPPVLSPAPLERARHLTVLADRERIAHELNDRVIQRIFAIGLDLQGTIARSRSSEITARLNRSVTDLQTVIEDIRTTVFELHASAIQRELANTSWRLLLRLLPMVVKSRSAENLCAAQRWQRQAVTSTRRARR